MISHFLGRATGIMTIFLSLAFDAGRHRRLKQMKDYIWKQGNKIKTCCCKAKPCAYKQSDVIILKTTTTKKALSSYSLSLGLIDLFVDIPETLWATDNHELVPHHYPSSPTYNPVTNYKYFPLLPNISSYYTLLPMGIYPSLFIVNQCFSVRTPSRSSLWFKAFHR